MYMAVIPKAKGVKPEKGKEKEVQELGAGDGDGDVEMISGEGKELFRKFEDLSTYMEKRLVSSANNATTTGFEAMVVHGVSCRRIPGRDNTGGGKEYG